MKTRSRQLSLDLRALPRWGGRRAGAGRKPGPIRRDPHRRRPPLARCYPCHVTLRVRHDVPSLRTMRLVRELEASFRRACERGRFRLVEYSIQTNHVHLLVEATSADGLGRGMKSLGSRVARAVNRVLARRGPVLADRYHVRVLRTPREVRNALAYVLLSARRHKARTAAFASSSYRSGLVGALVRGVVPGFLGAEGRRSCGSGCAPDLAVENRLAPGGVDRSTGGAGRREG